MAGLSPQAREFINRFQGGFPIVERPFHGVAAKLGMRETVLIQTITELLDQGVLSRFGPLYDATLLGGAVTLAALSAPEADYGRIAETVNALPAVAHNYRREHALNMWFVVASERAYGVRDALGEIRRRTGLAVYDFPKLREFYLGLWLDIDARDRVTTVPVPLTSAPDTTLPLPQDAARIVAATQGGLPLVVEPYARVADELGVPVSTLTAGLQRMLDAGAIRRIGAVPNHYRLGLRGNGMTVWDVPDNRVAEFGALIGGQPFVSHCYERPRHAGVWPYNLFAMVHGHDRSEVLDKSARLRELLGGDVRAHEVLFSSAVLKKTGLRLAA
ncbi:MAG: Lrp/AsnC family transcriptional regulator [Gammaproteobacteria bacterium]|nr:Lrp/AsnC family transcriptional regulator [Gammaproteobacteria bacterium]MCP5298588.1 Lrp/AsnC family transcriptional regulator [Chromatiaceae bacterium]